MKTGRPSSYTPELVEKIIALINLGKSETKICRMAGMPSLQTLWNWKKKHPEFLAATIEARKASAELYNDKRLATAAALHKEMKSRSASGEGFPPGVVEAYKVVMQELAREAAIRDDSRFSDRKRVNVEATISSDIPAGLATVYERIRHSAEKGHAG